MAWSVMNAPDEEPPPIVTLPGGCHARRCCSVVGGEGADEEDVMKIAVAGATGRVGRHVVEVLGARGHEVVPISRSSGVDLVTGRGLDEALSGVHTVVDAASGPSPDQKAATDFFATATRNLQETGRRTGVERMVVVSIIGIDRFTSGYAAAKQVHEKAMLSGSIPVRIL